MGPVKEVSRQFHQLPMFMTPEEAGALRSNDYRTWRAGEVTPEMRDSRELEPNGYRGARDAAHYLERMAWHHQRQGGISEPIHVWLDKASDNGRLVDGHHRVSVAQQSGHLLPVVHHEGDFNTVYGSAFLGPTADSDMRKQFGHTGDSRKYLKNNPFKP